MRKDGMSPSTDELDSALRGVREVWVAAPHGFCAGVARAVEIVEVALARWGAPLYVYHEIVHNTQVVGQFQDRGVRFVDRVEEVPEGATIVFSAHGVAPAVVAEAKARGLRVVDATCPLVSKVHAEVRRFAGRGFTTLLVGHEGHDEVVGTMGVAPGRVVLVETPEEAGEIDLSESGGVACVTQTTLSLSDAAAVLGVLRERFPTLQEPPSSDICYATENRQNAVRELACRAEVILVLGSENSSNTLRLVEVAQEAGARAFRLNGVEELRPEWLSGAATVGVTAGASTPEPSVEALLDLFRSRLLPVRPMPGEAEDVVFGLPPGLS
jgi:4-hydroxy-3-methylbut-2-enyl diphosphate reductase